MRVVGALVGLAALVAALVMMPAPAWAHDELTGTSPADGSTVTAAVTEVTLTFSGVVRADGSTVTVTGADGQVHSSGAVSVVDTVVHQPVTGLASGTYRVDWRIVAGDGDPMTGQFSFTLTLPPEPTPTSTPEPTTGGQTPGTSAPETGDDGGTAWWPVLALVLVVAVVAALVLRRRRGSP
jgi:LPXTG-motif cell wall-anchored protein